MTVRELIAELKKIENKSLQVFWSDHDHSEYEINDEVRRVWVVDKSKMENKDIDECFADTPFLYVVIRG